MNAGLRRVKFDQIVSVAEHSRRVQNKIKHEYANVIGFFQTAKYTKERKVFWEGLKVEGGRTALKKHPWGVFAARNWILRPFAALRLKKRKLALSNIICVLTSNR